jgi:hypothetical protein
LSFSSSFSSFSSTFNADSSLFCLPRENNQIKAKTKKSKDKKRGIKTTKTFLWKRDPHYCNAHNTHTHAYLKRQQQGKPTTLLSRGII